MSEMHSYMETAYRKIAARRAAEAKRKARADARMARILARQAEGKEHLARREVLLAGMPLAEKEQQTRAFQQAAADLLLPIVTDLNAAPKSAQALLTGAHPFVLTPRGGSIDHAAFDLWHHDKECGLRLWVHNLSGRGLCVQVLNYDNYNARTTQLFETPLATPRRITNFKKLLAYKIIELGC